MPKSEVMKKCSKCGCGVKMSKEMADVIAHSITAPLLCTKCAKEVSNAR